MNAGNVEEYQAALRGEAAHRPIAERETATALERLRAGRTDWLGDSYEMSESDQVELGQDLAGALDEMENAVGRSVDGWVDDMLAAVRPWGFDLDAIRCPVRLDYGRKDAFVPPAHGDWLVEHIPGATAFITDSGHLGSEQLLNDIFRWLRDGPDQDGAAA
jgi:pimeloyl-ACP methyl ester carboxylesterase